MYITIEEDKFYRIDLNAFSTRYKITQFSIHSQGENVKGKL